MKLNYQAAEQAIKQDIASALGFTLQQAAAGIYRVINANMAQGVREISIKRGVDPREFPLVVAGGAGPLHACMIAHELEIPLCIVPRESSIFCAAGMLLSDLQHDFVRSFVSVLSEIDFKRLQSVIQEMTDEGEALLAEEKIPPQAREVFLKLDCRYVKQYHEVSFPVELQLVKSCDVPAIARSFHSEHQRMYGYSLEAEGTPIELINVRLQVVGRTKKPSYSEEPYAGADAKSALKGERSIYVPEAQRFSAVPVYDGHRTGYGNLLRGPAIVEQVNTTLLLSASYDCICDSFGSFVVFQKGKESHLSQKLQEILP